ncbi:MAG: lipid A biosynthesis acyltransferase, partial [Nitrospirota bacterium]
MKKTMTRKATWLLETCFLILLSAPLAVLPLPITQKAGEAIGLLLSTLWRSRTRIALENLRNSAASGALVLSESPEETVRKSFGNFGRSFAEVLKIYFGFGRKIISSVEFQGVEHFEAAREKGKGVLFITGHCG